MADRNLGQWNKKLVQMARIRQAISKQLVLVA